MRCFVRTTSGHAPNRAQLIQGLGGGGGETLGLCLHSEWASLPPSSLHQRCCAADFPSQRQRLRRRSKSRRRRGVKQLLVGKIGGGKSIWYIYSLEFYMKKIKSQLEEKESRNFDTFDAVSYKTQVVAGINYFIKIHVGNDEYFHVRVYKRLPHENKPMELTNYQSKKEKHDDLTYF